VGTALVIGYGCCVGSWDKFYKNVVPWTGSKSTGVIALSGQTSICRAYNSILNAVSSMGLDAMVLLHDDLEIIDSYAETKFLAAVAEPDVALVGVIGGTPDPPSISWWETPTRVGHQMTDSGLLDFGRPTGLADVLFIEGSIMVFSPWAIQNLRFDTRYPGFLGYDDICVTAKLIHKKRVVVTDVDTHHHSTVGFKSEAIRQSWYEADQIFREKWGV
jgi:Glycosyltransferase like family